VVDLDAAGVTMRNILTEGAIRNAMAVHAACGGSTNLLLHVPAIAHSAGLPRPTAADWHRINLAVPRLVDVLPNGPADHPTVRLFLAGGVPEVMLHLRGLGLLDLECLTVTGRRLGDNLEEWERSERRERLRERLKEQDKVDADDVIHSPDRARAKGLTSTVTFPVGNLCPEGAVIKSTSIDPSVVDADGVYRKTGRARVFTSERDAIVAIKRVHASEPGKAASSPPLAGGVGEGAAAVYLGEGANALNPGDILVLICRGPIGAGMEEIYQITSALKFLPWGKSIAVLTDARFSGVSTGACVGHIGPEALAGGPIGKLLDGDVIEIVIDRNKLEGTINLIGVGEEVYGPEKGAEILASRSSRPDLTPDPQLPDDTKLWAALQAVGGGTWGGCVYDVEAITAMLRPR
jgi:dihydroxyacid dehydratase/phosphogluconate dehydratase